MTKSSLFHLWRDLSLGRRIVVESLFWVSALVLVEALFFGEAGSFGGAVFAGIGFGVFFAVINHICIAQIKKATDE
ncbi:MAG TPA: hypothetical protein VK363_04425 [Pyrinomonadaceae bacterium]|nr:hypothetical protein [Pyrinomonadaceae bacterium]